MDEAIRSGMIKQAAIEPYAKKLKMEVVQLERGFALVEMRSQSDNLNIFGMVHGGAIFSLIDEAFQLSCNSHGTLAVALNMNITYHKSPQKRSTLRAESKEIQRSHKTATYLIRVTDETDTLIASCQALAFRKGERLPFLPE